MKIMFVVKGSDDSGNFITISRIKQNLEKLNNDIISEFYKIEYDNIHSFAQHYKSFEPDAIIGLNLVRCLFLLEVPISVKIILILGGTDINANSQLNEMQKLKSLILRSRYIVGFSKEMIETFNEKFKDISSQINLRLIPQGMNDIEDFVNEIPNNLKHLFNMPYFVVVGRLRTVKDPGYAIEPFLYWQSLAKKNVNYQLIYIGNVEEESTDIQDFFQNIEGRVSIKYLHSMPHEQLLSVMKNSSGLINCSKNEGQSTTILEAMKIGVLVIARKVVGNIGLIKDNSNGLLFENKSELVAAMSKSQDLELKSRITKSAQYYVEKYHSSIVEATSYLELLID